MLLISCDFEPSETRLIHFSVFNLTLRHILGWPHIYCSHWHEPHVSLCTVASEIMQLLANSYPPYSNGPITAWQPQLNTAGMSNFAFLHMLQIVELWWLSWHLNILWGVFLFNATFGSYVKMCCWKFEALWRGCSMWLRSASAALARINIPA